MITVYISTESRPLQEATERWIQEQLARRPADGQLICFRVVIKENNASLAFATARCGGSGGGGGGVPQFDAREQEVIADWKKHKRENGDFPSGHAMVFLKALTRILDL